MDENNSTWNVCKTEENMYTTLKINGNFLMLLKKITSHSDKKKFAIIQ